MMSFARKLAGPFLRPVIICLLRLRNNLTRKIKNRVLFIDAAFRQENGWALMEALSKKRGVDIVYYSECSRPETLPSNVRWCSNKKEVRRAFYSSPFVFYTHASLHRAYTPGRGQTVVNLWHGTPLKDISMYQEGVFKERDAFSYVISASVEVDTLMRKTFGCPEEKILTLGYPRNDWLFTEKDVFSPLGIDRGAFKKTVIWMPTFRKAASIGRSDSDRDFPIVTPEDMPGLNAALRDRGVLLIIKPHPAADALRLLPEKLSNIMLLTNGELAAAGLQTYELLGRCDLLITDYSSVYFDFLITGKPIIFAFDDLESYRDRLGFFFDDPTSVMPGPKAHTVSELLDAMDELLDGNDRYAGEREAVNRRFNLYSDRDSRDRLISYLGIDR